MKIILDAMGGDNAPLAPVDGAIQAAEKLGVEVVLTGSTEAVQSALEQYATALCKVVKLLVSKSATLKTDAVKACIR